MKVNSLILNTIAATMVISGATAGCSSDVPATDFTASELALIREVGSRSQDEPSDIPAGTMRVLTIENDADLAILRAKSTDLSDAALLSDDYSALCSLMVATVTDPSQDGVGIAGPQVGLNRRVVAVQRFDKEGEPFEVYPNIRITWASDSLEPGPEGCLSVPDRRGDVLRSQEIVIEYTAVEDCGSDAAHLKTVKEAINGFTAVIFQHEVDHLEGILYIDRL